MGDSVIYYVEQADEPVNRAGERARKTFKYFWRELFWERRRIISALDFAMVKVPFFQDGEICEHMWIDDIYFDGLYIYGVLNNEPGGLTNVEQGESVCVPVGDISDWMFVCNGIPYGGFTVQAMRGQMTEEERTEHDTAWGIDFGDPGQVLPVYEEKEHPENLEEHPMCRNCIDDFRQQLSQNPDFCMSRTKTAIRRFIMKPWQEMHLWFKPCLNTAQILPQRHRKAIPPSILPA